MYRHVLREILVLSLAVQSLQHWTKHSKSEKQPWPKERSYHAACCLDYGQKDPKLLVIGGEHKDDETLRDVWILHVNSGSWEQVRRKCRCTVHSVMVLHRCHPSLLWLCSFSFMTVFQCPAVLTVYMALPVPITILQNYNVVQ